MAEFHGSGQLFDDIDFMLNIAATQTILENTYNYLPDIDPVTKLFLAEASKLYAEMHVEEIWTYATVEDFHYYW